MFLSQNQGLRGHAIIMIMILKRLPTLKVFCSFSPQEIILISDAHANIPSKLVLIQSANNFQPEVPVFIKPPMKDKQVWTGYPHYDRYLHIRVYQPQGLDCRELKCSLKFGNQKYKTAVLDVKVYHQCFVILQCLINFVSFMHRRKRRKFLRRPLSTHSLQRLQCAVEDLLDPGEAEEEVSN
jgi:hypothetical protein